MGGEKGGIGGGGVSPRESMESQAPPATHTRGNGTKRGHYILHSSPYLSWKDIRCLLFLSTCQAWCCHGDEGWFMEMKVREVLGILCHCCREQELV